MLVVGGAGLVPPARAEDKALLRLHAVTVDLGDPGHASLGALEIAIERWATEEEHEQLLDTLIEKGSRPSGNQAPSRLHPDLDSPGLGHSICPRSAFR